MISRFLRTWWLPLWIFCLFVCLPEQVILAMPPVQRTVLPNGLVILHSEDHSLPFVTLELLVDGGSTRDPGGQEGLANLVAEGLLLGTSGRTAADINEALDFMGASLTSTSGRDYSTLTLRILKKDVGRGLALVREVLTKPAFPEEEIRREVEKTLAAILSEEDDPGTVAEKEFEKAIYHGSPYGHRAMGTSESLRSITREGIFKFYRAYYHPNNYILAVVGDISPEEVKTTVVPLFEGMKSVELPRAAFSPALVKGPEEIRIDREITQANIVVGNRGVNRESPDFYAISVMNYILGDGGYSSRLVEEIRNRRGLAYDVSSSFEAGKYAGSFQIVLQTSNASAAEAVSLARRQTELMQKELVSEKEIERAKKYLIGSFPLHLDTQGSLATFLVHVEYHGLGLEYPEQYRSRIQSVTKDDVRRVARKYLHPERFTVVIVGNLREAEPSAKPESNCSENRFEGHEAFRKEEVE